MLPMPSPEPVHVTIALEPTYSILMIITSLRDPENYGGFDPWLSETVKRMGPELHAKHRALTSFFWLDGLTNLVERGPATEDFDLFLQAIEALDPIKMRDTLFHHLLYSAHIRVSYEHGPLPTPSKGEMLVDFGRFEAEINDLFRIKFPDFDLRTSFDLLNQPEQLKSEVTTHLRLIWERYVCTEWERVRPRLAETVKRFQAVSFHNATILDAMQIATGRDFRPAFRLDELYKYRHIRFIPHVHHGPYIIWFGDETELRVGFPAHEPPVDQYAGLRFDKATLAKRMQALGDETRLEILWEIRQKGELETQAIIERFDLNKSAASRHLRQLVANNLILERRDAGATKVYRVNGEALEEITQMINGLQ